MLVSNVYDSNFRLLDVTRKQPKKRKPKIKKAYKKFYESEAWLRLRYRALQKYGRRCQCCGAEPKNGIRLHVDHIQPRIRYPHLELKLSNLQILCEECNKGKGCQYEDDFR